MRLVRSRHARELRQVYCVQHHRDSSQPRGIRVELAAMQLEEPDTDIHNGIIFLGLCCVALWLRSQACLQWFLTRLTTAVLWHLMSHLERRLVIPHTRNTMASPQLCQSDANSALSYACLRSGCPTAAEIRGYLSLARTAFLSPCSGASPRTWRC